jgi:putative membrane protein
MMIGFGFVGVLLMLLFWGILIAAAVLLVRALFLRSQGWENAGGPQRSRPEDILNRRYARGEIDREEYELKKSDLGR